jgi:hypothetical protein
MQYCVFVKNRNQARPVLLAGRDYTRTSGLPDAVCYIVIPG